MDGSGSSQHSSVGIVVACSKSRSRSSDNNTYDRVLTTGKKGFGLLGKRTDMIWRAEAGWKLSSQEKLNRAQHQKIIPIPFP